VTGVRQEVVEIVAARVRTLPLPARVGIDGVTAAGKSTFADELAQLVAAEELRFEYAAKLRDEIKDLRRELNVIEQARA